MATHQIKGFYKLFKSYVIIFVVASMALTCNRKKAQEESNIIYTCSMDPQVMEKKPGKCPICKMELTKTIISSKDKGNIQLSDTQIKLGNIKTEKVEKGRGGKIIQLRGVVVEDPRNVSILSSRVAGRIDKLYFKNTGEEIKAGDHVYDLYSEILQASVKQYLLLKEKSKELEKSAIDYKGMLNSAIQKLVILGMNQDQINKLSPKNSSDLIPFYSKVHGIISDIKVKEGDYINEGSSLLEVADLSSVWIEAEVYPRDLQVVQAGLKVNVVAEAYPNEAIEGKISFENPELEPQSRFSLVRIEIVNKEKKYKPGMRVSVRVRLEEYSSLWIPEEAVLNQPGMDVVWVRNDKGSFSPRMVETGTKGQGQVEVISGLKEGETIVISGAYLVDSEYRLRNGTEGMSGMHHEDTKNQEVPTHQH